MDELKTTLEYMLHNNVICNKGEKVNHFILLSKKLVTLRKVMKSMKQTA